MTAIIIGSPHNAIKGSHCSFDLSARHNNNIQSIKSNNPEAAKFVHITGINAFNLRAGNRTQIS